MSEAGQDVVIMGGGIAGLIAANRLAQLGRRPLVLERGTDESYMCNSRITGGAFHVCYRDVMTEPADLEAAISATVHGSENPALRKVVAGNAKRVVEFLAAEGVRFLKAGPQEYQNRVLAPPRPNAPGLHWKGRGGDVLLRTLEANLLKRGGAMRRGSRVAGIQHTSQGIAVSVESDSGPDTLYPRAVLIADGGFQGSIPLLERFVSRAAERLLQRGAGTGVGDGIRIAESLGAALVDMGNFYGHPMSRDALTSPELWPYPFLDSLVTAGIVVGEDGRRFVNEGEGGVFVANAIAKLSDPLTALVVFDEKIWKGPGAHGLIPANPHAARGGGKVESAGDIETLAAKLGMDALVLSNTVAEFNRAVDSNTLPALTPPRYAAKYAAMALSQPPFHAIRLCSGITYTMGGISIDGQARVLRANGDPIPGIYAAGTVTGGIEGGPTAGYVGGLVASGATALAAAEDIASRAA